MRGGERNEEIEEEMNLELYYQNIAERERERERECGGRRG